VRLFLSESASCHSEGLLALDIGLYVQVTIENISIFCHCTVCSYLVGLVMAVMNAGNKGVYISTRFTSIWPLVGPAIRR
jgi:hypothetical protein